MNGMIHLRQFIREFIHFDVKILLTILFKIIV